MTAIEMKRVIFYIEAILKTELDQVEIKTKSSPFKGISIKLDFSDLDVDLDADLDEGNTPIITIEVSQ